MRLTRVERGHRLPQKLILWMIRVMTGRRAPDIIRTLFYRPEFLGKPLSAWTQAVMGPRFIGQATRARIANFAMTHTMDIYGQMVVYLRLNGVVPPASRREN